MTYPQGMSGTDRQDHDAPFAEGILENMMDTLRDGVNGYEVAIEAIDNPDVTEQLTELRAEREQMLTELAGLATRHAADVEEAASGTAGGALRRTWMRLKGSIAGDDAVLEVVEAAEREAYDQFSRNTGAGLPDDVAAVVSRHTQKLADAAERVAGLRS